MPGLNEMLAGNRASGRWNSYNEVKCVWYGQIKVLVLALGVASHGPGFATMLFCEPNRKRDPDNLVSGGAKILLDSLVGCEVLPGDDWNSNLGFIGFWQHTPGRAGCLFHWDDELISRASMLELLEKEQGKDGIANNRLRAVDDEPLRKAARKAAARGSLARGQLGSR